MLVGNNIALVVFTTLMTKLLSPWIEPIVGSGASLLIFNTLCITAVVLIFGEFLPKTMFRIYADTAMNLLAMPLQFFKWLLSIPTWLMTNLSTSILNTFFQRSQESQPITFTRLDLEHFVQDSFEGESDDEIDTDIFKNALRLKDTKVRDCMVPRNEIVAIDDEEDMQELIEQFDASKLSRILVYAGDIDNVKGYIHHQQMLKQPKRLKSVISDIPFVPEVMNIQAVMNMFFLRKKNIACVVDEFGGTAGVITLEDILEEIFGEIEDEHDQEEHIEELLAELEWLFSGRLEIDYLNENYHDLELPECEYNTISGYIIMTTANIPEQGDVVILEGHEFHLVNVSNTKIETVRVKKISEPSS